MHEYNERTYLTPDECPGCLDKNSLCWEHQMSYDEKRRHLWKAWLTSPVVWLAVVVGSVLAWTHA